MNEKKEILVAKIENGTVIDHITAGRALAVLKILNITGKEKNRVSILINADSKKMIKKDIIKVEERELSADEVSLISLISLDATVNIVKGYEIVKKTKLTLPKRVKGLLRCNSHTCISNQDPEATPTFNVIESKPLKLSCVYCRTYLYEEDVLYQILGEKQ
ncbi:aspartate carbamoyltransferase regulatory subunit [Sulfolobales archaeon HS-7]|nr:aspartate carbamoyltransferase regulatory subunit [Sulfolobales archaeon HS-7]